MAITEVDHKFLEHIDQLEPKALCTRAKVACVIVRNGEILSEGVNDWHKEANCSEIGCIRDIREVPSGTRREICYGMCAEQWALAKAAKAGIAVDQATCYVTKHPCRVCESLLTEAGIIRVVYQEGYPDALPNFNLFQQRGITVEQAPSTAKKSTAIPKSLSI